MATPSCAAASDRPTQPSVPKDFLPTRQSAFARTSSGTRSGRAMAVRTESRPYVSSGAEIARSEHPQDLLRAARLGKEVAQRRPDVVPVKAELFQPTGLVCGEDHGLGALDELQIVLGVCRSRSAQGGFAAGRQQPLGAVLADRLQQRVAERA